MDYHFLNTFGGEDSDIAVACMGCTPSGALCNAFNLLIEIHLKVPILKCLPLIQRFVIQIRGLFVYLLDLTIFKHLLIEILILIFIFLVFIEVLEFSLTGDHQA